MQSDRMVEDLATRLVKLEKSSRRQRLALGAALIALVSLVLTAAGRQEGTAVKDVVEARKFVLRDANGNEVAVLSVEKGGGAFRLIGVGGKRGAHVELAVNEFTSRFRMFDGDSQISISQAGGPMVVPSIGINGMHGNQGWNLFYSTPDFTKLSVMSGSRFAIESTARAPDAPGSRPTRLVSGQTLDAPLKVFDAEGKLSQILPR